MVINPLGSYSADIRFDSRMGDKSPRNGLHATNEIYRSETRPLTQRSRYAAISMGEECHAIYRQFKLPRCRHLSSQVKM